jgi:hypothetical protein
LISGITKVILIGMKTAISIPDRIFGAADQMARRLGLSRSQFYVTAIKVYVEKHRNEKVTEKLNEVYGKADPGLDPAFQSMQAKTLGHAGW